MPEDTLPAWADIKESEDRNVGTIEKPYFVKKADIPKLLNDQDLIKKINMYIRSKKWGLPFAGGWMNQPAWIMEVLDTLDNIEALYDERTTNN